MQKQKHTIYTIGHSTHPQVYFLEILKAYAIDVLVDIRTTPASTFNPQYNQVGLKNLLKKNGMRYMHFAKGFGARPKAPKVRDHTGQVSFKKVRSTKVFQQKINRLQQDLEKGYKIVLMSSKSDPVICHRFAMIGPKLKVLGYKVHHILPDKASISQEELETQLLKD